jgi:hypothetical protein
MQSQKNCNIIKFFYYLTEGVLLSVRLWSLHPGYLDAKGLMALWREGLLALKVLRGKTKGYKNHPQLLRFLAEKDPVKSMQCYLWFIYTEAVNRGYHFDLTKIERQPKCGQIIVTSGQLKFELVHLKRKLKLRDIDKYRIIENEQMPKPHPFFKIITGDIEKWEKVP